MKEVVILLLLSLLLNGCGSSTPTTTNQTAQSAASGLWSADVSGGAFSFITEFTVNTAGSLSITYFQFLNDQACFPISGGTESGTINLSINGSTDAVTGTLTYIVTEGGNTLTLTGPVTGTASGTTSISGGSVTGDWKLTGGAGCTPTEGSFTMTQNSGT